MSDRKFCIILRGLPGTGKTIMAQLLSTIAAPGKSVTLGADSFFTSEGKFSFDKTRLKEAHESTFADFKAEIEKQTPLIIVDNTNIKNFHYWHYLDWAQRNGYIVGILTMPHNDVSNRELAERNVHGVDQNTIRRMRHSFEWEIERA
jgi:broad-specificity NMP kinase